jgi:topoisomerase IV subunit A
LEIVSTDWRPVAEIVFAKVKGVQKENQTIDLEQFISIKGIKAIGNQLTTEKLKQVNLLESLPYEEPIEVIPEEIEVIETTPEEGSDLKDFNINLDEDGQITLSLD